MDCILSMCLKKLLQENNNKTLIGVPRAHFEQLCSPWDRDTMSIDIDNIILKIYQYFDWKNGGLMSKLMRSRTHRMRLPTQLLNT